jgi:hypothetical protein
MKAAVTAALTAEAERAIETFHSELSRENIEDLVTLDSRYSEAHEALATDAPQLSYAERTLMILFGERHE